MFSFYKMIEQIANSSDENFSSIKELTIRLANDAGYHRKMYTFKNGSQRERTFYTKPFDDILTAKWFMYYKHLFISKLIKHPELKEYHTNIITRTFMVAMTSLNLDKMITDDVINKYINLSLESRFADILYSKGSGKRFEHFLETGDNSKLRINYAINDLSLSLDELNDVSKEFYEESMNDIGSNDYLYILDLKNLLKDTKFGDRLLISLLNTNKRVQLNHIDDFILMNKDEMTEDSKKDIAIAYDIIRRYLKPNQRFRKLDYKKIKYSFERVVV